MAAPREHARGGRTWRRITELTGLDLERLDSAGLDRWIESRSRVLGIDRNAYAERLLHDEAERRSLSAQIAVPESWVGRYPASFELIERIARRRAAEGARLRVVSIGCAAGQELVSLALVAMDAGIPPSRLDLHGVDRNREAIAQAKSGRLPRLAMRGELADRWSSRFSREEDGWRVPVEIHRTLRFHEADALVDPMPMADGTADLVLCRNVLIYLSSAARTRLVARAVDLLSPDGILLVGHADPPADVRGTLHAIDAPGAFAWEVGGNRSKPIRATSVDDGASSSSGGDPGTIRPGESIQDRGSEPTPSMDEIRNLADAGRLDEARIHGQLLLDRSGSTPELECLLGEVASADDRPEDARDHWRRALYLDAGHVPALQHLILWCEASGDPEAAAVHRRRLDRLEGGRESDP